MREAIFDGLVFLGLDRYRFEVLGFENLPAVHTLHVVDTVTSGDNRRSVVLTSGSHTKAGDTTYSKHPNCCVKGESGGN
jgi:hypothetical protein